jgi:hypothetical protein
MEVLILWPCPCYGQPHDVRFSVRCSYCTGTGYLKLWVAYSLLPDLEALFKDLYIMARRRYRINHPLLP